MNSADSILTLAEERELLTNVTKDLKSLSEFLARGVWHSGWMLFGRFVLLANSDFNNVGRVAAVNWRLPFDPDFLNPVVRLEDIKGLLRLRNGEFPAFNHYWPTDPIPTDSTLCPGCDSGWDINNFWVRYAEDTRPEHFSLPMLVLWHPRCWAISDHLKELDWFKNIFAQVPLLKNTPIVPVKSRDSTESRPWFKLLLPGGDITIGWQRSIIYIGFPEHVTAGGQFLLENVTQGDNYIHAHGEAKAVEYLAAISHRLRHPLPGSFNLNWTW